MVKGIEIFSEKLKNYTDCFTVIGGTACEILMTENAINFRETRDIDMILIVKDRFSTFAHAFWQFIKDGGYKCGWKNNDETHFYRFTEPKPGYPIQIELFSRDINQDFTSSEGIIPIHIDDDISSLSAILLDDDFYNLMMLGRRIVRGIPILDTEYLILFKMYAFLNVVEKKEGGQFVKERDYKKHKYDVFRLMQIANREKQIAIPKKIKEIAKRFCDFIENENIPYETLGLVGDKSSDLNAMWKMYSLKS